MGTNDNEDEAGANAAGEGGQSAASTSGVEGLTGKPREQIDSTSGEGTPHLDLDLGEGITRRPWKQGRMYRTTCGSPWPIW